MRKAILALVLLPGLVSAQDFIRYYPPASAGGMADPGSDGIMVRTAADTSVARSLTSPLGTLAIGNADGVAGNPTLDVDTSIMGQFSSGAGTAPATCVQGDFYYETDTFFATACPVTDNPVTLIGKAETSTSGFGFVIDEDSFATNSATKVPTQQSVKAYVDANAGASFDPGTTFELYEEFATGVVATTGYIGSNGMDAAVVAGGTLTTSVASGANNPGVMRLLSHTSTDNSGAYVRFLSNSSSSANLLPAWNAGTWTLDAVVIIGSNSTAITNTDLLVGLFNGTTYQSSAAVWIRHDSDMADGAFMFQVCNASGAAGCDAAADDTNSKTVASTITPSAGTAYRFRIRRAPVGVGGNATIYMRVNDEAEKTFCSSGCDDTLATMSTGAMAFGVMYLTRTTSGVMSSDVDYMRLTMTLARY